MRSRWARIPVSTAGSIDDTVVDRGTKIDNLVQVGHNVHIGERCLIMAGVGIAGSTRSAMM